MYTFITGHTHTHLLVFFPSHLRTRCIHEEKKDILLLGHSVHMYAKSLSRVQPFAALWTIALQVSLSMGFTRQEYCSGLSCPPPGDLPDPEVKPTSLISPALASRCFTTSTTWKGQQLQRSSPKKLEVQASHWAPQPGDPSLE